ncbi:hypothetical protein NQ176_g3466 [Zarea fungicola]|uniref:Uncharacterized protein n=1 Tax=Zarea fungicola TaxID=93591 RepID=A0ACC1NJP3_9HYPO|nr:hypothetical protein NQ176_g3466 [Lecanicillium fungicola]
MLLFHFLTSRLLEPIHVWMTMLGPDHVLANVGHLQIPAFDKRQPIPGESDVAYDAGCSGYVVIKIPRIQMGRVLRAKGFRQVPGLEWTSRWSKEISDPLDTWASSEIRTIHISEGYSDHAMELRVRQFVPITGDKLERTWNYNGQQISVSIPPFALIDLDEARKSFARHIDANIQDALRRVTGTSARMIRATYLQAWRLGQRLGVDPEVSAIIHATMRLWTSTRLNTTSTFIVGIDTLGMPPDILDETSPTPGKIPLPPVLGAQLNLVMIHHIQARLRKTVLDQLQRIVQKNKHSTWLVTYFVDFILLHNASMIISHDAGYARKHGINRRFAREDKVKEYHAAYFHYCNKGLYPFSDECSDAELRGLAQLTDRDVEFVRATRKYAKHRGLRPEITALAQKHLVLNICIAFSQHKEGGEMPLSEIASEMVRAERLVGAALTKRGFHDETRTSRSRKLEQRNDE